MTAPQGDVVAVEDAGYEPARRAFAHHGAKLAAVPVDQSGMEVDHITRKARVIVVTPSHQAPWFSALGVTPPATPRPRQRQRRRRHRGRLRHRVPPRRPLHLLDARGRVVYVGSFSKTLSPSLRLGFLVAPSAVIDELARARHVIDTQPPYLTQAALAAFIGTGAYERHLRRCHRVYRMRREHVIALLDHLVGDRIIAAFDPCTAGLHTTVQLRPDTDTERVAEQLRAGGIAITTTAANRLTDGPTDLVVGFGLADEQISDAVDALRTAVDR